MDLTGAPGTLWGREPAAIVFTLEAIIIAAVSFGLDLTGEQMGAVLLAATAILGLVTRASVVSPATRDQNVAVARNLGSTDR